MVRTPTIIVNKLFWVYSTLIHWWQTSLFCIWFSFTYTWVIFLLFDIPISPYFICFLVTIQDANNPVAHPKYDIRASLFAHCISVCMYEWVCGWVAIFLRAHPFLKVIAKHCIIHQLPWVLPTGYTVVHTDQCCIYCPSSWQTTNSRRGILKTAKSL